jgi:type III secretory pathway component EscV
MGTNSPIRPVTIRLPASLHAGATASAAARVEAALGALLSDMGVAGTVAVGLVAGSRFELEIDGHVCGCPSELLAQAFAYATGSAALPDHTRIDGELAGLEPAAIDELIELACCALLSEHPAALEPDVPSLAADAIDLLVEPGYLRELSYLDATATTFAFMREGLFVELGLPVPAVRLVADPSLRPNGFAVRVGYKRAVPWIGLPAGTLLVNATAERLGFLALDAQDATIPASRQPAALVRAADAQTLEASGLTTWDQLGYLVLVLAEGVRRNAHVLLTRKVLSETLGRLEPAFPVLTQAVRDQDGLDVMLPALQDLLEDQVSIRNMPRIIELLLHHEALQEEEPDVNLVSTLRRGLADEIGFKFARGTATLVAYILDPAIEEEVVEAAADPRWPYTELADEIRAILAAELSHLPRTAETPIVLTRDDVRVGLRSALRVGLPRISVLGYGDLLPSRNVQPVARLSRN